MSESISRRKLLKLGVAGGCGLALATAVRGPAALPPAADAAAPSRHAIEARHYERLNHLRVRCTLCPNLCEVGDMERGFCGVRENRNGTYYSLVYGNPCSLNVDPIEKKPLYHFLPGTKAYSLATVGCNMECKFCQNWEISQIRPEQSRNYDLPPTKVAAKAKQAGARTIAFTYTEPVVFWEYVYDTAVKAREAGVESVFISNGFIQPKPMRELCQVLSAVKIDLKAFTDRFYREICLGKLRPVLDTLVLLKKEGTFCEIVYLVIPTLNDRLSEIKAMAKWLSTNLGPDVPIHFSRFYPRYKLKNLPPTSMKTLEAIRDAALSEGLHYVYIGNIPPGHPAENTYCPKCKKTLVRRKRYDVDVCGIRAGRCVYCSTPVPGLWT